MIFKGSQRAGARQLAVHLLNTRDNDHVKLLELRGFVADNLGGAFREIEAISKGTRCKQFMFSLSLNPPKGIDAGEQDFQRAADEAERRLGLDGQPRAIVMHEKEGRRHAHVVWSRIDPEKMRAINLPHFKYKLTALSRELYLEHGWSLPSGLQRNGGKSPLNFTLEEWQQAKRVDLDPREIKDALRSAWDRSDNVKAFASALEDRGYSLARGDRRGFVALDLNGEVYSLSRWLDIKTKDVRYKLGDGKDLPSVDQTRQHIAGRVTDKLRTFIADTKARHTRDLTPLRGEKDRLRSSHRAERARLKAKQEERWQSEAKARAERLRTGLVGLWDKFTGKAQVIRYQNETDAYDGLQRDRRQRDQLASDQLAERRLLQERIDALRRRHVQQRKDLNSQIRQLLDSRAPPVGQRPRGPALER